MTRPSPRIEALLQALAADAPYRDAILGDLAEEFTIRVEEQGASEARRWYRLQALRTAPHLLRQWARGLSAREIARLCIYTMFGHAFFSVMLLAWFAAIVTSYGVVIDRVDVIFFAWRDLVETGAVNPMLARLGAASFSVVFGYLLARAERRAPLGTCVVVGMAVAAQLLVMSVVYPSRDIWSQILIPCIAATGTAIHGALRALSSPVLRRGSSTKR